MADYNTTHLARCNVWGDEPVSTRTRGTGTIGKRGRPVFDPEGDALVQPANERERHQRRQRSQRKDDEDSGLHPRQGTGCGVEDVARFLPRARLYEHHEPTERFGTPTGGRPARTSQKRSEAPVERDSRTRTRTETSHPSDGPPGRQQSRHAAACETGSEIASPFHSGGADSHSSGSLRAEYPSRLSSSRSIRNSPFGFPARKHNCRNSSFGSTGDGSGSSRAGSGLCGSTPADSTRRFTGSRCRRHSRPRNAVFRPCGY